MAKGYKPTEYMYSSARLRSLETKIVGREELNRLVDADGAENILLSLTDHGFELVRNSLGEILREDTLMSALKSGFSELADMGCADVTHFLQYQYDCNNIKAIIKCDARGISPDGMLIPFGSVNVEAAKDAFLNKNYSVFPPAMAKAISEAEEAFAATANPQKIDFIIDRACFADMLMSADECGIELAKRLVICKIDLVNIMQTLRIMRMGLKESATALADEVYIEGGSLGKRCFTDAISDKAGFVQTLFGSKYYSIAQMVENDAPLGDIEKKIDNIYLDMAKTAKSVPFGAEVAVGYIFAIEYEIKNIRIILAGKEAGLPSEVIRERLRECYV